jgi:hypothetical protein
MSDNQTAPTRKGWSGNTKNTLDNSAMLGAKWWKPGDELACVFNRTFQTKYGQGYEFLLAKPQSLHVLTDTYGMSIKADESHPDARKITRFALPNLSGFDMAVQDLKTGAPGFGDFRFGDRCIIRCVEIREAKEFGFSDMPMFNIVVDPR